MSVLLTIDWDAFIPEDPYWDIGHKENILFATLLWQHRLELVKEYKLDDLYKTFWNHIDLSNVTEILVSDSHLDAHYILSKESFDHVVLVDAHHDAWEYRDDGENVTVDCASWLRYWLDNYRFYNRKAVWYQPTWAHELFTVPVDMPIKHRDLDTKVKELYQYKPDVVHVCRSGSWSPPWFDTNFIEFLRIPGLDVTDIGNTEYIDPMEIRMTMEEALTGAEERRKEWALIHAANADIAMRRHSDENVTEKKSA